MIKAIVIVLGVLLLVGMCSGEKRNQSNNKPSNNKPTDFDYIYLTKQGLEKRLKDPESAQFRNERVSRSSGNPVVCGEVNAKNGFGGFTGFEPYIGLGDLVVMDNDMAQGEFAELWNKACQ